LRKYTHGYLKTFINLLLPFIRRRIRTIRKVRAPISEYEKVFYKRKVTIKSKRKFIFKNDSIVK